MPSSARRWLALVAVLASALPAAGQDLDFFDRPTTFIPLRSETARDREQRESLKLYALGALCQRDDRILEALAAYEKAVGLDPQAAPVHKALIPLYLALERADDAFKATRKVLDLDPEDYRTWYLYARQLRSRSEWQPTCEALERALACAEVKDHAEVKFQLHFDLGCLHERASEPEKAVREFTHAAALLEDPENAHEFAPLKREEIVVRAAELEERIGRIRLQGRKYEQALAAFRKAQTLYPDGGGRLNYNLALVSVEQNKMAEALGYLDAYLRLQPQSTEPYELKIRLLRELNRSGEILLWLARASAGDRHNERLKRLLATQYALAGQAAQAEKVYVDLARESPSQEIYQGLFKLYKDEPQLGMGKALTQFDEAFNAAADKRNPLQRLAAAQAKAMLAAIREGKEFGAELVRAAGPLSDRGARFTQETYHLLAVMAEREGQAEQAERYYRESLKLAIADVQPLVYGGLLRVLWKARKYQEVVDTCREALRTAKEASQTLYHSELARGLARLEQFDEALQEADNALRVASAGDRLGASHLRVRILVQAKQYDKAEAECLALLKQHTQPGE